MKWIGQHIWDFISRFRSDVYLESVDSGTIASGGNLGLDSNNKIVKATTVGSATLASTVTVTDSTASTNFPIVFHDESNSLLDDTGTFTYNPGAGTFEFSTSGVSAFFLNNSGTNAVSGQMYLQNKRNGGAGSINDNTGKIVFQGQNSNSETISFAAIVTSIEDETDGDEAGEMVIQVTASDDSTSQLRQALTATGHGTDDKVDIGLGYGAASLTTVAGSLTVTSDLTVSGTTTTINTTNLNVEDKNIILNYNASSDTSGTADGAGITIQDAVDASNDASLTWVAASDKFGFSHAVDITNGASGGVAALTIDNDDVDVNALLIEAANTTEHILDIEAGALTTADAIHVKADALTTGAAINLDINDSLTTSATKSLLKIDYDKSGVTASGQTSMTAGLEIDMRDTATNHALGSVINFGAVITLGATSDQGSIQQTGLGVYLTDADTSNSTGICSSVEDGGVDFKAVSSVNTADYFTIATTTNGETTLATVDGSGNAADLTLDADGEIVLDVHTGEDIFFKENGTERFHFYLDNTPTIEVTGNFNFNSTGASIIKSDINKIDVEYDFHSSTFENDYDDDQSSGVILKYSPGADESPAGSELFFLHTDGTWDQTNANDVTTGASQLLAVGRGASARTDGVLLKGFVRIASTEILNQPHFTDISGLPVYVSTTPGHFDFTAPSGQNDFVRIVGYAIDQHGGDVLIYFDPDKSWVEIA